MSPSDAKPVPAKSELPPVTPEAPDEPQPPGAGGLEADARIQLEHPAGVVVRTGEADPG